MPTSNKVLLLQNLPHNVQVHEIQSFLQGIQIIKDGINIIYIKSKEDPNILKVKKAFVKCQTEQDVLKAMKDYHRKPIRNNNREKINLISVTQTTRREMEREINNIRNILVKKNLEMTCEWLDCNKKFQDRTLYLSHINNVHVQTFVDDMKDKNKCKWEGCYDDTCYKNREHFQLHLSFHAFHNQLMNIGQRIMDSTTPKPTCFGDSSSRNSAILTDLFSTLMCGWKGCKGVFHDAETFFQHVDIHAIEDIKIPMMSKEKLEKVRYAKCQWLNCQSTFKRKAHLKMHLATHTQKKYVACPICGCWFSTRIGFLNHCYRQETPTDLDMTPTMIHGQNFTMDDDVEEGILTIDEDANQSSIVIRLPHNILPSQASSNTATLLVNFDQKNVTTSDGDNQSSQQHDNVIKLQLKTTSSSTNNHAHHNSNIIREHKCQYCPKSFNTQALLTEHVLRHNKQFTCPHCPYTAIYRSRIKEHILFRHSDTCEFKCTFCGKALKTRSILRRHIEMNHSEKKYICNFCEQTFSAFHSLNHHVRIQHLKEEIIFTCHICSSKYNRGNNLSRHLIRAHGLKIADGYSRFVYEKHQDEQNPYGIYRINPLSCTSK